MNPYQYPPLSGPRCTRLIRLHPGATKDPSCPLSCDLVEMDLDNPPDYLALSYTWNGETPSEPLTIGNAQVDTSQVAGSQLLITPNCAAALRVFRKSFHRRINRRKSLTLWIDAICIDQDSNDDKSSQVAMMAEIFKQAKKVVVWLGDRDSPLASSTIVCSLACALLPNVNMGRLSDFFDWTRRSKAFRWLDPLVERLEKWTANAILNCCNKSTIHAMLHNPYWTRVWTVQEFANAHVSFLCQNSNMISCAGMTKMISFGYHLMERYTSHHSLYAERRAFGHRSPDTIKFPGGLKSLTALQASEPRDKIFGLRALSAEVFAKVAVDYERPLQDLFTETSMVVFKETNSLYLLYFASLERTSPGTGTGLMPSWSFDFGTKDFHEGYRGAQMDQNTQSSHASRGSYPRIFFPEPGISLRVLGRSVGLIGDSISDFDPTDNPHLIAKAVSTEESHLDSDENDAGSFSGTETYEHPFMRLMESFIDSVRRKLGTNLRAEIKMVCVILELMRSIIELADIEPDKMPSLAPKGTFRDLLEIFREDGDLRHRLNFDMGEGRMFITIDGRAGLGVPRISEGDEIFLIAGLKHPFVLRPHGDNGEYTLVGPAIVTGMMKGELWPEDGTELRDIDIV